MLNKIQCDVGTVMTCGPQLKGAGVMEFRKWAGSRRTTTRRISATTIPATPNPAVDTFKMPAESASKTDKQASQAQAREVIDVFHEISTLLNADLDRQTLSICISLIENGVNPEALACVVRELKKDAEETRREIQNGSQ
ncbi:hypothetical protein LZ554_006047 [Drepanopeziza brunnea f. sp. 'monogermtubi']|nr:hypothetical protein LZ554_006047 [Drepanopeziza brunnea f. sp. 'monogermtubi']